MILITGATGMTGRFVVQELNRRKMPTRMLVRQESVDKVAGLEGEIAIGDLSDFSSLHRAMDGVRGVAHVACTFTDMAIDVTATGTLVDGWQDGPFIFVSSLDVYGNTQANPVTEAHPLSENYGDYGRGKVLCERLVRAKADHLGRTDFAMVRAPHILGPHPKGYQRFTAKFADGNPLLLPGADEAEWSQYRDAWIDVRDLAWVIVELLERPIGGPLNVLAGHMVWHDFYAELIRLSGSSSQLIHKPQAEMSDEEKEATTVYAQSWLFDDTTLRQSLGYSPQFTLDQTLADMFAAK